MNRTPALDQHFGAEYDRFPVEGLTREEYIVKRYVIAERRVIPAAFRPERALFAPSTERTADRAAPRKSAFDWTGK